jgi:hypothetical protein
MEAVEYPDMKDTGDLLADLFTYSKLAKFPTNGITTVQAN